MKTITKVAMTASVAACATMLSFGWSEKSGVSLSVEEAQARVGRPLTPVSGAGVVRRQNRRAAYGGYGGYGGYGLGLAGAAAVGTAAAVASSPYYGPGYYGGGPYYGSGYGAGGPYYGPGVLGARAAYYGYSAPSDCSTGQGCVGQSTPWTLVGAYQAGGPFYGYSGWADYKTRNGIACDPGTPGCQ